MGNGVPESLHGDQDSLVPIEQRYKLYAALKEAGDDVVLHVVNGAGHGKGFGAEENELAVEFFKRTLK